MKRMLASVLTGAMLVGLCAAPAGAVYQDAQDHWAEAAIEVWSGHGVVQGDNGSFRPNDSITRAEMAAILVRLLGLTETDGTSFMDVAPDAWYADAIAKCAAAGIMKGDNGMARPNDPISRQEAMVMLGRALGIQEANRSEKTYLDGELVSDWAAGYVNALTNRGIVDGVGGGRLAPLSEINRASVVTILNNAITDYVNQPGQTVTVSGDGITVVAAADVTVTGATAGDILIAAGAASGSVKLDGLKAEGSVVVTAPAASVTITGSAEVSSLLVDADAERAQVIVETDGQADDITVSAATASVIVKGEVSSVETTESADGARITVEESGTVDKVAVSSDNTSVAVEGEVSKVTTGASATDISGTGKVESVTAQAGASDVTVSTPKTDITVSSSADGSVTVNKAEVKPGESGTTNSRGDNVVIDRDESSGSKPSSGSSEPDETYYTVTFLDGETVVDTLQVREGRTVAKPADPVKEGYTFGGWYAGETAYDFEAPVTGKLTLTAKWNVNDYTITLKDAGGQQADKTTGAAHGSTLDEAALKQMVAMTGSHASGWYTDQECTNAYAFESPVTGDMTLYYQMAVNEYQIQFVVSDGTEVAPATLAHGGSFSELETPVKDGFTFDGWYLDDAYTEKAATAEHAMTVYGRWQHTASKLYGTGTEADPFLIGTAKDFANIYSVYTSDNKPDITYYKLTADITASKMYSVSGWDVITPYLINSVFDGNNKTVTAADGVYPFYLAQNATICNLNVNVTNSSVSGFVQGSVEFDCVHVSGSMNLTGNEGAYVVYVYSTSTLTFRGCVANVEMQGKGGNADYNAIFVGCAFGTEGPALTLNFEDCINEGTIVCGRAAMFGGNLYGPGQASGTRIDINVTNCANNGVIRATYVDEAYTHNYFEAMTYDNTNVTLDGEAVSDFLIATNDTLAGTGIFINGPEDADLALTRDENGGFTITPASQSGVAYYKISIGLYTRYSEGGSNRFYVTSSEITDTNEEISLKYLSFVDAEWLENNSDAIEGTLDGNTIYTKDDVSYYYLTREDETLNGAVSDPTIVFVSAYDADGNLLCSASLSE